MSDVLWHIYLLRTRKGTIYTGITLDVARRLEEHAGKHGKGAKYLRPLKPLRLEYSAPVGNKTTALRLERRIKRLCKAQKEKIIQDQQDAGSLLSRLGIQPN